MPSPADRLARLTRKPERALGTREEMNRLLDGQLVGTLATVVDGQPWVVPMLYGRDGDNLLLSVPVTYPEAALGADVTVPTLDGDAVTIRVPAGTRSGRTFRVRGKGVATPKTTGDLLVTIEIDVPTEIGDDERVALEALAAARTGPSPRAHLEV